MRRTRRRRRAGTRASNQSPRRRASLATRFPRYDLLLQRLFSAATCGRQCREQDASGVPQLVSATASLNRRDREMASKPFKTLEIASRRQWRTWLDKHHASHAEIWLVFSKQHTGQKGIEYRD